MWLGFSEFLKLQSYAKIAFDWTLTTDVSTLGSEKVFVLDSSVQNPTQSNNLSLFFILASLSNCNFFLFLSSSHYFYRLSIIFDILDQSLRSFGGMNLVLVKVLVTFEDFLYSKYELSPKLLTNQFMILKSFVRSKFFLSILSSFTLYCCLKD